MASVEHDPQRERTPQYSWQRMKSPLRGERCPVVTEIVTWNPDVMPNNLEINPDRINALIKSLALPYSVVEIQRLDQSRRPRPLVVGIDGSGQALAAGIAVAAEQESARSCKDHKAEIKINFDWLYTKAGALAQSPAEKQTRYAELVEDVFRKQLTLIALETMSKRLEADVLSVTALALAVISSMMVYNMGERDTEATRLTLAALGSLSVLYKSLTSVVYFMHRFSHDEEFRHQLFYKATLKHQSGNKRNLEELQREEMDVAFLESIMALPFYQNSRATLQLLISELQRLAVGNTLFRSVTHSVSHKDQT